MYVLSSRTEKEKSRSFPSISIMTSLKNSKNRGNLPDGTEKIVRKIGEFEKSKFEKSGVECVADVSP